MNNLSKFYLAFLTVLFFTSYATANANDEIVSLNDAIRIATENIENSLGHISLGDSASRADSAEKAMLSGNMSFENLRQQAQEFNKKPVIAVLNISSDIPALSAHIIDELLLSLAKSNRLDVVTRQKLDIIREEQNFQLSDEVDEHKWVSIGKFYGANYIITGKLLKIGSNYRFHLMALDVESAGMKAPTTLTISGNDPQIKHFLGIENEKITEEKRQERKASLKAIFGDKRHFWSVGVNVGSMYGGIHIVPLALGIYLAIDLDSMLSLIPALGGILYASMPAWFPSYFDFLKDKGFSPAFSGNINTTLSPFPYSFLELGCNALFINPNGIEGSDYVSFYPYANYLFFIGSNGYEKGGLFLGLGTGRMFTVQGTPERTKYGDLLHDKFALNVILGGKMGRNPNYFDLRGIGSFDFEKGFYYTVLCGYSFRLFNK